ncbi:calcium-binding protein [Paludisphaera rhizosphaerae]|uniref:calcium-binding protein n=1 Tax=Paludisphaera rhizosphaerae TaxID=2711216 RepID=UPI0013EB6723|nr:calcium-binding protein [Paludisphaera rhizosphaerae]
MGKRSFRPSLTALEGRVVLSADTVLSASIQSYSNGDRYIVVDGSDYDDTIQVLNYQPGYNGSITLKLEKWSNGVKLSSSTATYHAGSSHSLSTTSPLSIQAKGGNDTIINNTSAPMYADGGDGNDWFYGGTSRDYINGGNGNDTIYGNAGDDYLDGGAGNDTIRAGSGNDTVYGGDGNDFLDGESGNDSVLGMGGDDTVYGGDGNDYVDGGSGNDYLSGGAGNDNLYGYAGNDTLSGDAGDDKLYGGDGDDYLYGGDGNDQLRGEAGYDRLYGGNGNDYLDAGYRIGGSIDYGEYLQGGAGADTFVRHKSVFSFDDIDYFSDYNSGQGDTTETNWHW